MTEPRVTNAPDAALRRVAIDPLSRVEGHGKVTLQLDADNRVVQARLHIVEFRGFEAFIVGRPYWEVPVMVQRLCGICPVSHHLAASKALDAALALPVPAAAHQLRRLMHHAQILQSHALHFFYLASPDLLLGFDSPAVQRQVLNVARAHPEIARDGVMLRAFGQDIIEMTAGKRIHGTGATVGGVNRRPTAAERASLRARWPAVLAACERAVDLAEQLRRLDAQRHASFGAAPMGMMSLLAGDGALDLYDGALRVCDADAQVITDAHPVARYGDLIIETTQPWTWMKFPYLRALGPQAGSYRVGPLARLQVCDRLGTPRAEARRQAWRAHTPEPGRVQHGALATHGARLIEMLHATEVIGDILADDSWSEGPLAAPAPGPAQEEREGVGAIEAPRGTLIHHYRVGADDRITDCNLIVSTTHNNQAMHDSIGAVARQYFDGREVTEPLLNHIEVAVRAYDPCLSCATHALGSMPLQVGLVDADGQPRGGLQRGGDGRCQSWMPEAPHAALGLA
jgi:NAD-reducing hydrogenase large subunit